MPIPSQLQDETIDVVVEEVVFRNAETHFAVVRVRPENGGEHFVAIGDMASITEGEIARLVGRYGTHATHGKRFEVRAYSPIVPSTAAGIARYLGSGAIPGIGPAMAERIVQRFGKDTLDIIAHQSGRLREISGIGEKRARAIGDTVRAQRMEAETLSFLQALGLGSAVSRRVRQAYGDRTMHVLREDPYRLARDIRGIGFVVADRAARATGILETDSRRRRAAIIHCAETFLADGHTYFEKTHLETAATQLGVHADGLEEELDTLVAEHALTKDGNAFYLPEVYDNETLVADFLGRRVATAPGRDTAHDIELDTSLAPLQRDAVRASLTEQLLIITGGPGTGKTTTVRSILALHAKREQRVLLAAPTGRAAKRLSETTKYEAKTIHRMLEWNPGTGAFSRNAMTPLDADVVLVDEASMLDLSLARALFDALRRETRLVLVGDPNQLPPVGAGQVLRAALDTQSVPTVRLTEIFRQAASSDIVRGAHEILHGRVPAFTRAKTRTSGDIFFVAANNPTDAQKKVSEVLVRIRETYGFDPKRDVQVLVPMRKGPVGTGAINRILQQENSPGRVRDRLFNPGDKVMQLRNDYEREVFNGDIGEVVESSAAGVIVGFDGRAVHYANENLEAIDLAYATTVHKAQGSEFPAVVLVLMNAHYMMLDRQLVYTAVTRAQKLVVVIGEASSLRNAVARSARDTPRSQLVSRINQVAVAYSSASKSPTTAS